MLSVLGGHQSRSWTTLNASTLGAVTRSLGVHRLLAVSGPYESEFRGSREITVQPRIGPIERLRGQRIL